MAQRTKGNAVRPNPVTTLVVSLLAIVFWFIAVYYWAHHNDHWALFWFAWCVSLTNVATIRLMRYRGAI
jgi:hypothetical protein